MKNIIIITIISIIALTHPVFGGIPRPEHPRPDFERPLWLNLNGYWNFDFDENNRGIYEKWFRKHDYSQKILVPFPWESRLSGINTSGHNKGERYKPHIEDPSKWKDVYGWYERTVLIPSSWSKKNVIIKFGAVDWMARVWVNGRFIGKHEGGYTPFEFDITKYISFGEEARITVRALEPANLTELLCAKQCSWYTRTSGIWQTVYLEARGSSYISTIHFTPDIDNSKVKCRVDAVVEKADDILLSLKFTAPDNTTFSKEVNAGSTQMVFDIAVPNQQLWEPSSPGLYHVSAELRKPGRVYDTVKTYFGMRKVSRGRYSDADNYEYVFLNNQPVYLLGVLNQSFHPDGIYTYPDDDTIRNDMLKVKESGFNFVRIHIKIDEPRVLYWADKLGVLLMCDMPNFFSYTSGSKSRWTKTLKETIKRDYNHPSIFSWCLFNESWGFQEYAEPFYTPSKKRWIIKMYELAKALDNTRLIEDMSACNRDHIRTDINSWHFYKYDYQSAKTHINEVVEKTYPGSKFNYIKYEQDGAPLINSEYGGIGCTDGDVDVSACFKYLTNEFRLHQKICGYVYTELQDIEWENNGIINYDRTPKEFGYGDVCPGMQLSYINSPDFIVIDKQPFSKQGPGSRFSADVYLSHWSQDEIVTPILKWELLGTGTMGKSIDTGISGSLDVEPLRYRVIKAGTISFDLPEQQMVGTFKVWLEDGSGNVRAMNYINVDIYKYPPPRHEKTSTARHLVRYNPGDYKKISWPDNVQKQELAWGGGAGYIEYSIRLPDEIDVSGITGIGLLFEAASEKPGMPQTDVNISPSDISLSINGYEVGTVTLDDDLSDSRGILSHTNSNEKANGNYGYLMNITLKDKDLIRNLKDSIHNRSIDIRYEVKPDAENISGLRIYGDRLGRYAVDPALIILLN